MSEYLDRYKNYDNEMKLSVCGAAFQIFPHCNFPPHKGIFELARSIGYPIPEQWVHLYIEEIK